MCFSRRINNTKLKNKKGENIMAKYTKKQVIALFLDSINYPCKIKENDEYPGYMTYNFNILDFHVQGKIK